jgi:hypothetical protein
MMAKADIIMVIQNGDPANHFLHPMARGQIAGKQILEIGGFPCPERWAQKGLGRVYGAGLKLQLFSFL